MNRMKQRNKYNHLFSTYFWITSTWLNSLMTHLGEELRKGVLKVNTPLAY
jgi:hypothetical protein